MMQRHFKIVSAVRLGFGGLASNLSRRKLFHFGHLGFEANLQLELVSECEDTVVAVSRVKVLALDCQVHGVLHVRVRRLQSFVNH